MNIQTIPSIQFVGHGLDVSHAVRQIEAHPEAWNEHTSRTQGYATPHARISDIWVRYNALENLKDDPVAFNGEHESVWYPVVHRIPAVWSLARHVFRAVKGVRLGGVLITKVPAGGEVKPHEDHGWHAEYYEKFAVQLKGNVEQSFNFTDATLRPVAGDLYTFRNERTHWVLNPSNEDRMTMIVCVRRAA